MSALKWIVGIGIAGSGLFALAPTRSQTPANQTDLTLLPYASVKESAHLPNGRVIHVICAGRGKPTVILTAGKGRWAVDWSKVQPAVATKTRVCAWDRAGFGLSSPSSVEQTVDNTTTDLEAALKARQINGPYILVGHSMGAYESLIFADRHPLAVLGMVLVDPSIPDQAALFQKAAPARDAYFKQNDREFLVFLTHCAAAIRTGKVGAGTPDPEGCLEPPPSPPSFPDALRRALSRQFTTSGAAGLETMASYFGSSDKDTRLVINQHRNYDAKSLIVLTAADMPDETDLPAAVMAELPKQMDVLWHGHAAYATLSLQGTRQSVTGTSHFIQQMKPQVVVDAIDQIIDKVRTGRVGR